MRRAAVRNAVSEHRKRELMTRMPNAIFLTMRTKRYERRCERPCRHIPLPATTAAYPKPPAHTMRAIGTTSRAHRTFFCAFAASIAIAIRFRGCLEIQKNDGVYCSFRNLHSSKYRKNKCEHKLRSIFFSAPAARIMCVCSTIPYVEPARAHAKNSYHSRHIRWRVLANRHRVRNIQRGDSGRVCTISPRMS
jgi:hypothetical protein